MSVLRGSSSVATGATPAAAASLAPRRGAPPGCAPAAASPPTRMRHRLTSAGTLALDQASEPDASSPGVDGCHETHHGVRRCPRSSCSTAPHARLTILMVWSPCVDASSRPHGDTAIAMVERVPGGSAGAETHEARASDRRSAQRPSGPRSAAPPSPRSRRRSSPATPPGGGPPGGMPGGRRAI